MKPGCHGARFRPLVLLLAGAATLNAQILPRILKPKEDKKQERTQVLELPKDPPAAVVADTRNLVFEVSPLRNKGLLTEQAQDALKWIVKRGRPVVHLRAFVAGTGDVRRIQTLVSEAFTDKRLALPSLTVLQAGSLALEGAQVQIEATEVDRREVNPAGLAFIAGQGAADGPEAIARVRGVAQAAGADVLRVTCFLSSMEDSMPLRRAAFAEFPGAALAIVQRLRAPEEDGAVCEAAARLRAAPPGGVELTPQAALVGPRRVALTGGQLAFGFEQSDARLAFERLGKSLEQVQASYEGLAVARLYPLSRPIGDIARKAGAEFFAGKGAPAATVLPVEGLPSMDATFAVEVVAVLPGTR
jgi:enamine deaminase RidA (YjgF/YER057c/UK114 family)